MKKLVKSRKKIFKGWWCSNGGWWRGHHTLYTHTHTHIHTQGSVSTMDEKEIEQMVIYSFTQFLLIFTHFYSFLLIFTHLYSYSLQMSNIMGKVYTLHHSLALSLLPLWLKKYYFFLKNIWLFFKNIWLFFTFAHTMLTLAHACTPVHCCIL